MIGIAIVHNVKITGVNSIAMCRSVSINGV